MRYNFLRSIDQTAAPSPNSSNDQCGFFIDPHHFLQKSLDFDLT